MPFKNSEAKKAYHRAYMRKRYKEDVEHRRKQKARSAVGNALRDGRLIKLPCANCGSNESQAHHTDYGMPLEVVWYCRGCHELLHGGPGCRK